MLIKYSLIISTLAVATLLIGTAITPTINAQIQTLGVPALETTTNTTAAVNTTALQAQIAGLQKQLYNAQHTDQIKQQAIESKLLQPIAQSDKAKNCAIDQHTPTTFKTYLTHFACGHLTVLANGTTLREFTLIVDDNHGVGHNMSITKEGLQFPAWTFNGSIPGPTLRMTQGDHVRVTVINSKNSLHPHSWHVHSIHSGAMDGVMGLAGMIWPGSEFTYEFVAQPYGVYPYHCHMAPVEEHINRGLYGMMIIDPQTPRPQATEMVMLMNGYSFNKANQTNPTEEGPPTPADMNNVTSRNQILNDQTPSNQVYTVNGMAFGYTGKNEIPLKVGQPVRIYLENMLEYDPINNFHLHGDLFNYIPSGTSEKPTMYTDIVSLMQGDRGILQFAYHFPGEFMFHAHKNEFTRLGWQGFFNVTKS
jgi:FtsP/CotA-like multicopper oxidase with cupredoxin domain